MKIISRLTLFAMLTVVIPQGALGFGRKTFIGIRSQAVNLAREMVGQYDLIHQCDAQDETLFSITADYERSFHHKQTAEQLFGRESLTFSGSLVEDRSQDDILADYFGLPPDFVSVVKNRPVITNFIMDFSWYCRLDCFCENLYFWFHVPVVHAKWDCNLHETVIVPGTQFFPAGYMGPTRINRTSTDPFEPVLAPSVNDALRGDTIFGDLHEPLAYGKVFGRQRKTRVAEVQCALGWDFFCDEWHHFGISVRAAAATGNKPNGEFLFEPIVGNMGHWELGGGFSSHAIVWNDEACDRSIGIYAEAVVTHLFAAKQKRSYDLIKNGPGSRYMLLECMNAPALDLLVGGQTPNAQYQRDLLQAINVTTLTSKIRIDVQADIALKVAYRDCGFMWDIGYNAWARSHEKLISRDKLPDNFYAVKGDAQVYGFRLTDDLAIPLSATQARATIKGGQGVTNFVPGDEYQNLNADNDAPATDGSAVVLNNLLAADAADLGFPVDQVQSSLPAILLQDTDIDEQSALLDRAISHKFFTYVGYEWDQDDCSAPFLGVGFSIEWAASERTSSVPSQWAFFAKGGFTF